MSVNNPLSGGALVPSANYEWTGDHEFTGAVTVTGTLSDSGSTLTSPTITGTVAGGATYTTPNIGVATATSVNKVAITAPATAATLTIADGKTLTVSNILTLAGTDSTTMTFPATSATIARTDAANTFTGVQTMTSAALTTPALTGTVTGTYTLGGTPTLASAAGVPYVGGVAAGYKLARSAAPVAVTGTSDITTGLATVVACGADAESDFDGTTLAAVQAVNTGGAGHILLKCWKITAADNGALIAANAAKNVSWWAIGT